MSQGEVKNPQTDQRVGNKSGHQGRKSQSDRSSNRSENSESDRERN